MFCKDNANRGNLKDICEQDKNGGPGDYTYIACMGEVYMFIKVKASQDMDPFSDLPCGNILPKYCFMINTSKEYQHDEKVRHKVSALGQSIHYAHIIQTRQFCTCIYLIFITGTTTHLLCWD